MKFDTFNELVEKQVELCKKVLMVKNKEYSSGEDRLHNFKVIARKLNITPEQACLVLMQKHVVSVEDIAGGKEATPEMMDEKFGDIINYYILLRALIEERQEEKKD